MAALDLDLLRVAVALEALTPELASGRRMNGGDVSVGVRVMNGRVAS